jgi:small subunit ribosomal protein S1
MATTPVAFVGTLAGSTGVLSSSQSSLMGSACHICPTRSALSSRSANPRMTVTAEIAVETAAPTLSASRSKGTMTKFDRMRLKFGLPTPEEAKTGFSYDEFANAMSDFDYNFKDGDRCVGRVYQYEPNGALVDIGAKASAYCPLPEMSMHRLDKPEDALDLGEDREFQIISNEDQNGQLRVSIRRMEFALAWERVAQLQSEDVTIYAEVIQVNRGGCLVLVEGLRAFLPGSHMAMRNPREDMVGVELPLKFLEVDAAKNRLVVSHRRAMVEKQITALVTGQIIQGVVRGVKPYGAFIDLNGVSGLLHISQISHDHISDISAVLKEGSEIKCMVLQQDKEKGRISLSTKTLEPEPGDFIRDPQMVFDRADEMCARYHARLEEERKAAADVADDIVSTLDMASLDDLAIDPVDAPMAS